MNKATEDGETAVALLTDLPQDVTAMQIAGLYRRRWTSESMFQKIESVLPASSRRLAILAPRSSLFLSPS